MTRVTALCIAAAFLAAITLAGLRGHIPSLVPPLYLLMSAITAGTYASDKARAQRGAWRVQEKTLHLLELCGGWPGGLLAQQWLRHKNRKLSFLVIFWLIAVLHIGLWLRFAWTKSGWE